MAQFTRSLLVLFTTLAAVAAGVLNGRVVCMAGANDVAIEEPHGDAGHSPEDHGCDGSTDSEHHQDPADGGCTDIESGATLVREADLASYSHEHAQIALPLLMPALAAVPHTSFPRTPEPRFAGTPPALADLACLRTIVLLQ